MQIPLVLTVGCIALHLQVGSAVAIGTITKDTGARTTEDVKSVEQDVGSDSSDASLSVYQIPNLLVSGIASGDVNLLSKISSAMVSTVEAGMRKRGFSPEMADFASTLNKTISGKMLGSLANRTQADKELLAYLYQAILKCHRTRTTSLSELVETNIQDHVGCRTRQAKTMDKENTCYARLRLLAEEKDAACNAKVHLNEALSSTADNYCKKGGTPVGNYAVSKAKFFKKAAANYAIIENNCQAAVKAVAKAKATCMRLMEQVDVLTSQCNLGQLTLMQHQCKLVETKMDTQLEYEACYKRTLDSYVARVGETKQKVLKRRLEFRVLNRILCYLPALGTKDTNAMSNVLQECIASRVDPSPMNIGFRRPPKMLVALSKSPRPCSRKFMQRAYSKLPEGMFIDMTVHSRRDKTGLEAPHCVTCATPQTQKPTPPPTPAPYCVRLTTKDEEGAAGGVTLIVDGRTSFQGKLKRKQTVKKCFGQPISKIRVKGKSAFGWIGAIEYSHLLDAWNPLMLGKVLTSEVAVSGSTALKDLGFQGCFKGRMCTLTVKPAKPPLCMMLNSTQSGGSYYTRGWFTLYFDSEAVFKGKMGEGKPLELCSADAVQKIEIQGAKKGGWFGSIYFQDENGNWKTMYHGKLKTDPIYVDEANEGEALSKNHCINGNRCELKSDSKLATPSSAPSNQLQWPNIEAEEDLNDVFEWKG